MVTRGSFGGAQTLGGSGDGTRAIEFVRDTGNIWAIGQTAEELLIARLHPDGSLDRGFGESGVGTFQLPATPWFGTLAVAGAVTDGRGAVTVIGTVSGRGDDFLSPTSTELWQLRIDGGGSPDTDFGSDGTIFTKFELLGGTPVVASVARRIDGGIVGAGTLCVDGPDDSSDRCDLLVVSLNPGGQLDQSFGDGGIWTFDVFGGEDRLYDVDVRSDGTIIGVGTACHSSVVRSDCDAVAAVITMTGEAVVEAIDPSGGSHDTFWGVAASPDGEITTVGSSGAALLMDRIPPEETGPHYRPAVIELDELGLPPHGVFTIRVGESQLGGGTVLLLQFLGGASFVIRVSESGSVDSGFGSEGTLALTSAPTESNPFHSADPPPVDLVVGSDETLVVLTSSFGLVRYGPDGGPLDCDRPSITIAWRDRQEGYLAESLSDGSLVLVAEVSSRERLDADVAFALIPVGNIGRGGLATGQLIDVGGHDTPIGLLVDSDDRITVATQSGAWGPIVLTRLTRTGEIDSTFGQDGSAVVDLEMSPLHSLQIATSRDGGVTIAGVHESAEGQQLLFIRVDPQGDLLASFGSDGVAAIAIPRGMAMDSLAVGDDGAIYAVGLDRHVRQVTLVALTANGQQLGPRVADVDSLLRPGVTPEITHVDGQGRVTLLASADGRLVAARFLPDGTSDSSFGENGIAETAIPGEWSIQAIGVRASDGAALVAGTRPSGSPNGLVVASLPGAHSGSAQSFSIDQTIFRLTGVGFHGSDGVLVADYYLGASIVEQADLRNACG